MYWKESAPEEQGEGKTNAVDMVFRIQCPRLPVDHAYDLLQAVATELPWFTEETGAGIHSIYGAGSGNGWLRPPRGQDGILHLSKRVRLILRVPQSRVEQCVALCGVMLQVADYRLMVNSYSLRAIQPTPTLFARGVTTAVDETEASFLERIHHNLLDLGMTVPKLLPGLTHEIQLPGQNLRVRSLLLADVSAADSVKLQEIGFDENRKLGCGLFVPHKSVASVVPT